MVSISLAGFSAELNRCDISHVSNFPGVDIAGNS
jgi:hypothetical protein